MLICPHRTYSETRSIVNEQVIRWLAFAPETNQAVCVQLAATSRQMLLPVTISARDKEATTMSSSQAYFTHLLLDWVGSQLFTCPD